MSAPPNYRAVRGKKRELAIEGLRGQLEAVRRAWRQGRAWRLAVARLNELGDLLPGVEGAIEQVHGAMDSARASSTLLERCAHLVWPASNSDDDAEWFLAWMEIARLADIPEGLALDVIEVSADDYRRSRRRRREALRERILAKSGHVYTFDSKTGTMMPDEHYMRCIDFEVDSRLRYGSRYP